MDARTCSSNWVSRLQSNMCLCSHENPLLARIPLCEERLGCGWDGNTEKDASFFGKTHRKKMLVRLHGASAHRYRKAAVQSRHMDSCLHHTQILGPTIATLVTRTKQKKEPTHCFIMSWLLFLGTGTRNRTGTDSSSIRFWVWRGYQLHHAGASLTGKA